ncbi:DUF4811 domain-containing protein [Streptococcus dysgalactiae]|uniref:DUF4811 domain-containing protein n=1 Tax=Streptococcus dysgalactiae TaxID=1334 RepID=A0AAE9ULN1_STRDY|nr:DUF4811 domain-containing protein [Streptococcus dysgalactiae]QGH04201.1 DUF4811 domain-containing protein [Streptococcus dysgalactiae subsp. dysgalactiae]WAI92877.1 DUF4811 domain-containing protein [Streptococcus dysgalactiae]WCE85571.1 DUF4811 domain-containing protein [Streptococcus dysgalactiae]WCN25571.1 DUF4811 domain-containing protein [Streptococcus dysgalactiae]BBE41147.1 hypothetical protein FGCSD_1922 [Streptococcus dysgalactiae]
MIILIIGLATIASFASWMLLPNAKQRFLLGTLSLGLLLGSVLYLTNHFVNHTGMSVETKRQTQAIYSAGDSKAPFGLLIYQPVGKTARHQVLIYRDKATDPKPRAHFIPDQKHMSQAIKKEAHYITTDSSKATVTTTTKRYVWKSKLAKAMFGFAGENGQLISQKTVVAIPKETWLAVTKAQAKQLAVLLPKLKADQAKLAQANPQAAAQLQQLLKKDPKAAAKQQVQALKKSLNSTSQ